MNRYDLTRTRVDRAAARRKETADQIAQDTERTRQAEQAFLEHAHARNLLAFAKQKLARLGMFKLTLTNELLTVEDRWSSDRLLLALCPVFGVVGVTISAAPGMWWLWVPAAALLFGALLIRPRALRVVIAAGDPWVAQLTDWHDGEPAPEKRRYVIRVLQQFEGAAMVQFPSLFDRLVAQVRRLRSRAS